MRGPRLATALLAAALALAACGGDGDDVDTTTSSSSTATTASTTSTTAGATTSSTAAPATTAPPTTAPPTTVDDGGGDSAAPGDLPTVPDQYATAFVEAWATGNRDFAERLGTPAAVEAIFAFEGGGSWSIGNCEGAAGSSYCTFSAGGSPTVTVRVLNEPASQGFEHAVTEVRVTG